MKSSVCGAYKFRLPAMPMTASITTDMPRSQQWSMLSNHCSKKTCASGKLAILVGAACPFSDAAGTSVGS
eukprot:6204875-Pleurochrysis_carterae.AAC.1